MAICLGNRCSFGLPYGAFVYRECLSIRLCASFPFGFEGGMWDLIVLIPDYCFSN